MIHGAASVPTRCRSRRAATIATVMIASVRDRVVASSCDSTNSGTRVAVRIPPSEQLVDDVRRRVREVVDVGEAREPERRERRDAQEPGDAREQRAEPDDGAGPDERGCSAPSSASLAGGSVTSRASRARTGRPAAPAPVREPPDGEEEPGADRRGTTPTPLTNAERIV